MTDAPGMSTLAFIPGISYGEDINDRHAFIQVLDAVRGRSEYFRFDISTFKFSEEKFEIKIGNNLFNAEGMEVSLENKHSSYSGKLLFSKIVPFPHNILSPRIMGPFRWAPFMECYHDVINIRHTLSGVIDTEDGGLDFNGGTGYLEKDWGSSFPKSWIWLQCNHFDEPGASFMLSYAPIPFMGTCFKGLVAFIRTESSFFRMATYNGFKVTSLDIGKDELNLIAVSRKRALNVRVVLEPGSILKAPRNGLMGKNITESLSSRIDITMIEKKGKILFMDKGRAAGVGLGGDKNDLIP